jgi:hypothetical protein
MATMSGLSWNENSKSIGRDWITVATVLTIETALVQTYRKLLLDACPGARALRFDLRSNLKSATPPYKLQQPGQRPTTLTNWDYPDNIAPNPNDTSETKVYNADELNTRFRQLESGGVKKNDPIRDWVLRTEKDKRLLCSSESAPKGALESLAHHAITTLARVGGHVILLWSTFEPDSQIMYMNQARLKHEGGPENTNDDANDNEAYSDFNMSLVTIPEFVRKPHAVTHEYRTEVSSIINHLHNTYYECTTSLGMTTVFGRTGCWMVMRCLHLIRPVRRSSLT